MSQVSHYPYYSNHHKCYIRYNRYLQEQNSKGLPQEQPISPHDCVNPCGRPDH